MSHVLIYPVRHSYSDSMARKMGLLTAHGVKAHSDHAATSASARSGKTLDRAAANVAGMGIADSEIRLGWLEIERWEDDGGY